MPQIDTSTDLTSEASDVCLLQTYAHFRLPTDGLPPPGNPIPLDGELPTHVRPIATPARNLKPIPISLHEHLSSTAIPSPVNPQTPVTLPDLQCLFDQIMQFWPQQEFPWPEIFEALPEAVQPDCAELLLTAPKGITSLSIYTDGSYSDKTPSGKAAWAFVVLAESPAGTAFIGHGYGLVEDCELEVGWTGALHSTAREAENEAIIHALEWAIRNSFDVETTFCFDCVNAGNIAAGLWSPQRDDPQANLLRSLALVLSTCLSPQSGVKWRHVRGHSAVLGNELADVLAKHAFRVQTCCGAFNHCEYLPYIVGEQPPIQWLWFVCTALHEQPHWPTFHQPNQFCFEPTTPDDADLLPANTMQRFRPMTETKHTQIALCIMSYNVGTLRQGGRYSLDTIPLFLREQLESHVVHIACLQETRATCDTMIVSQTHVRLVAGALKGRGGVELWLLRHAHPGGPNLLNVPDIVTLFASPELLIVQVVYAGIPLLLVAGHAPHTGCDETQHSHFWSQLDALIASFRQPSLTLILALDANAHFATECSPHIGACGLEQHANRASEHFAQLLTKHDLFIPSSFADIHEGPTWTWTSPANGSHARCDYICLPCSLRQVPLRTWVAFSLDVGQCIEDHVPLLCLVTLHYTAMPRNLGTKRLDRQAISRMTPDEWQSLFQEVETVPWHVDIDSHAVQLSAAIQQCLEKRFAITHSTPRRSYISESTWNLRKERIDAGRQVRHLRQYLQTFTLRAAFLVWRDCAPLASYLFVPGFVVYFGQLRSCQRSLHITASHLHRQLRQERNAFLEQVATEASSMPPHEFYRQIKQICSTGRLKRPKSQPLPVLRDSEGNLLRSRTAIAECWREFFAKQEDGSAISYEALKERHLANLAISEPTPDWSLLPTLQDIERHFRKTQSYRAYFDDAIPGEVLHCAPEVLAKHFYPLILKCALTQKEPLMYKGGLLVHAYKGRGPPAQCESHRSLMISSTVGKAIHSYYRQRLMPFFEDFALPMQVGGRPHKALTQASQTLIAAHYAFRKRKLNVGVLYIDIQNAFYRLLRQHVAHYEDERGIGALFESLNLPPTSYPEFLESMQEPNAVDAANVPRALRAMIGQFLENTWFVVRDSPTLTLTRQGSRPGDTLADLCFSFALTRILRQCFDQLGDTQDVQLYWSGKPEPFAEKPTVALGPICPIWADDLAVIITHTTPAGLIHSAQTIAGRLFERFALAGMTPNFKPAKTEIVIDLRGRAKAAVMRQIAEQDMVLPIRTAHVHADLRVVGKYKHLGTWLCTGGKLCYDLRTKFGQAHRTITKYKAPIFANRGLRIEKKVELFRSLVLSPLLFDAAAWHVLNPAEYRHFVNGIQRLCRRLALLHWGHCAMHWTADKIACDLCLEEPEVMLRISRLRYVQHLLRHGQPQLWGVLQQDSDWWHLIFQDCTWLETCLPGFLNGAHPQTDWFGFVRLVQPPGQRWKNAIKRALKLHIRYVGLQRHWRYWHDQIARRLLEAHVLPPVPREVAVTDFSCLLCRKTFASRAAWSVHAFKIHNRVTPARLCATGVQCSACLKHYGTHIALIHHVTNSQTCLAFLAAHATAEAIEPGWNSRAELRDRPLLQCPALQAEGPRHVASEPVYNPDREQFDLLHRAWTEAWYGHVDATLIQKCDALKQATFCTFLCCDRIRDAHVDWMQMQLLDENTHLDVIAVATLFVTQCTGTWFLGEQQITTDDRHHTWERCSQYWLETAFDVPSPTAGRIAYHPVIVAHLFSGRRRAGDLQSFLESKPFFQTGLVLSVDIVFHATAGDLTNPETLQLFCRAIREHRIHAIVSGPPCETWSTARTADDSGPRPLRSAQQPVGLIGLYLKELMQLIVGNNLLGVTFLLFVECILAGTFMLIEHPGEPGHMPDNASIWRLRITCILLRFQCTQMLFLHQGLYGAKSPKPTQFLITHGPPDAQRLLDYWRITEQMPIGRSIGRDASGAWRTASLKEYPPGLCQAITELIAASLKCATWSEPPTPPAEFLDAFRVLCQDFNLDAGMGPDFAGG